MPADVRRALDLKPSQKLEVIRIGERIELVAIRPIEAASGFLPGLDTTI
ncbi:MAG: AbrB/MazE/SpoVT family DNA-binding domain-containing protein [Pseudomonadota bacterium]|nr:AbrB/MazE/SpoVT family DNA-binding domain-containing protein [Pseudomonadota bacterium]